MGFCALASFGYMHLDLEKKLFCLHVYIYPVFDRVRDEILLEKRESYSRRCILPWKKPIRLTKKQKVYRRLSAFCGWLAGCSLMRFIATWLSRDFDPFQVSPYSLPHPTTETTKQTNPQQPYHTTPIQQPKPLKAHPSSPLHPMAPANKYPRYSNQPTHLPPQKSPSITITVIPSPFEAIKPLASHEP